MDDISVRLGLTASWPILYAHNRDGLDQTAKQIEKLLSERAVPIAGEVEIDLKGKRSYGSGCGFRRPI
jgi:hypothetical protein